MIWIDYTLLKAQDKLNENIEATPFFACHAE
jgi:hypothetical protein